MLSQNSEELSDREREILRLVATGASNKEIANKLVISPNTVKVHLRNIFAKIGAASRTEAALFAIHNGLVETPASAPTESATILGAPLPYVENRFPISRVEIEPDGITNILAPLSFGKTILGFVKRQAIMLIVLVVLLGLVFYEIYTSTANSPQAEAPTATVQVLNTSNRWHQYAPLPGPRARLAAVAYEGSIFAIGGSTQSGITGSVEKYDPATNEWSQAAEKPLAVADIQAAMIEDKIYVPGGKSADQSITNRMEIYDPLQDTWERGADLPKPISAYTLVAFEGNLFLFGGWDGQNYLPDVYEYNPTTNSWRTLAQLDSPRAYAGGTVVGNQIYIIGGYDGREALPSILNYRPNLGETGTWGESAQLPSGRYAMGVASLADSIYIFGGKTNQGETLSPWQYNPQSEEWFTFDAPNLNDWSHLAVIPLQNLIYLFGGDQQGEPSVENLAYQAIYTLSVPLIR